MKDSGCLESLMAQAAMLPPTPRYGALCDGTASAPIPTEGIVEIDDTDPISVRNRICQVHPFGELLTYEGIVEACRLGLGRKLIELSMPPAIAVPETMAIAEYIDPPAEWVMSFEDLGRRAFVILETRFFGIDEQHRQVILSVKDAGIVGHLAQANLAPPVQPRRRRPARRGRQMSFKMLGRKLGYGKSRSAQPGMPDLFKTFKD